MRFERRILDELVKMYNDSDSFYFSLTGDITNSLQRQMGKGGRGSTGDGSDCARLSPDKENLDGCLESDPIFRELFHLKSGGNFHNFCACSVSDFD